jgi:Ca2+/Na+ antiporter
MIGVGTSAPELAVFATAAVEGNYGLALPWSPVTS